MLSYGSWADFLRINGDMIGDDDLQVTDGSKEKSYQAIVMLESAMSISSASQRRT